MSKRVEAYFEMLHGLSSEDLDQSARDLALQEKRNSARLIAHIAEIGERRYHLEHGCKSMFDFCVRRLNLSEGSVYRRMQVARVCRQFPQILEALARGRLHLTAASLLAPHLTEENIASLITMAEGKTRREIEMNLVVLAPKEAFRASLRKQGTRKRKQNSEAATLEGAKGEEKTVPPSGGWRGRDLLKPATAELKPATEQRYNYRFSAGTEFTEKFKRLGEVLGIESPHRHMEEIFERALESALDKKDPQRKLERRRKREAKKQLSGSDKKGDACSEMHREEKASQSTLRSTAVPRQVPSLVREKVLDKAGYQCEYRGPAGLRCSSKTGLQVEHTKPFAVFRTHDERYLRAFCPAHNRFAAERFFGRAFIRQKISAARKRTAEGAEVEKLVQKTSGGGSAHPHAAVCR